MNRRWYSEGTTGILLLVPTLATVLLAYAGSPYADTPPGSNYLVYVGTTNTPPSKGIYALRFNSGTGQIESLGLVAEMERPSWLAVHPNLQFLYSVSELGNDGKVDGWLYSYRIDARTGRLTLLNKVSATGGGTTHAEVDKTGKVILAANYGGGQVVAFQLNQDGTIGRQTARIQHSDAGTQQKEGPHPHQVIFSADNRLVLVPDLTADKIFTYRLDPNKGTLSAGNPPFSAVPAGYGPRRFMFHPNGRFGYLMDQMQSAVTVFSYANATGELKELQTISTLPDDFKGEKGGVEIWIERSGRFLYTASRSDDTLAAFAIDPQKGTLTLIQRLPAQGGSPRGLMGDPSGKYVFVANPRSDNVVVFKIDSDTGKLTPTGQVINVPAAACFAFVPERNQ